MHASDGEEVGWCWEDSLSGLGSMHLPPAFSLYYPCPPFSDGCGGGGGVGDVRGGGSV